MLCTGDSDFTPLVHKLRELNKRMIGVGIEHSTSGLLPRPATSSTTPARAAQARPEDRAHAVAAALAAPEPKRASDTESATRPADVNALAGLVAQTIAGLGRSSGEVTASALKRTLLRKDPTFSEADYGFRAFGELLRHLTSLGVVELADADVVKLEWSSEADDYFLTAKR